MSYIDKYYEVKDKLVNYESTNKNLRKYLLRSNVPINEVVQIMSYLNYAEEREYSNESYFFPKQLTNQELKRVLEMI